jgi:hypothetical protein
VVTKGGRGVAYVRLVAGNTVHVERPLAVIKAQPASSPLDPLPESPGADTPMETSRLRLQLSDLVAERGNQVLLAPLTDVGRIERVHRPVIALAVSDERADAHDGMVDVLREFVAELGTNVRIRFADEIVGRCEPGEVGYSL